MTQQTQKLVGEFIKNQNENIKVVNLKISKE